MEKNFTDYLNMLKSCTERDTSKLVEFLIQTDMKHAPASSKYHLNVPGGLVQHSLNVAQFARTVNKELELELPLESVYISALLHDLCKTNYYITKQKWDAEYKEVTGKWRKMDYYAVDDNEPWGHGEKSVILALQYFELTKQEITAIRWHMGFSDPGTHFYYPTGDAFRKALAIHPLAKVIMIADQMAECYETK
jgi:HD superfamily phosphohydrolase YqeK